MPAKITLYPLLTGYACSWIAFTALVDTIWHPNAARSLKQPDELEHRCSLTAPDVEHCVTAGMQNKIQRSEMRIRQIIDMDEIA